MAITFALNELWMHIGWCAGEVGLVAPRHKLHALRVACGIANQRGDPVTPTTVRKILPCAKLKDVKDVWAMAEMTGGVAYDIEG